MFSKNQNDSYVNEHIEPEIEAPEEEVSDEVVVADTTRSVSYVGPTMSIKGEISGEETLVIEGQFEGKVSHCERNLTIGRKGRVNAEIHANTVEVRGIVDGEIHGEKLIHLFASAVVNGSLHSQRIIIDEGAQFNGTVDMKLDASRSVEEDLTGANDSDLPDNVSKVAV